MKRTTLHHTAKVRGGDLAFYEWPADAANAPVILAIHGITGSHRAWPYVADALLQFRIIAPDLRGRGRSNALPGPFGMKQHAEDCAAALDSLGVDHALVIGHSMGAFVATTFAAANPKRTDALLLVDGGLPLALPPGMDVDAVIKATLGGSFKRLTMTFATHEAYRDFWRVHPAMIGNWSPLMEAYSDYDLVGEAGSYHAATPIDALERDSRELFGTPEYDVALAHLPKLTSLLTAPRGLMNETPGLYKPETLKTWKNKLRVGRGPFGPKSLSISEVPDINHYMIVMSERGAQAVADEAIRLHALSRK
ncbi:MAG: alpha/beta hydrolase [Polyangiaceae bacterium]